MAISSFSRIASLAALAALFLVPAGVAQAATLSFDVDSSAVGVDQPFKMALLIDAQRPVNAFDVTVSLPKGVSVLDSSDGNSIITYWIDRPAYDAVHQTLHFSGIVPGGFYGSGATLATLTLVTDRPGSLLFSYSPSTQAILNDPSHAFDEIAARTKTVIAELSKQDFANQIPDHDAPEPFSPMLATSSDVLGGAWGVYFQAQDKGSGIYGYEAAEAPYLTNQYDSLVWTATESPYRLIDQSLGSYVYIRATDKSGNSRVEVLPPVRQAAWQASSFWSILLLILAIFSSAWLLKKVHSSRSRSQRFSS